MGGSQMIICDDDLVFEALCPYCDEPFDDADDYFIHMTLCSHKSMNEGA